MLYPTLRFVAGVALRWYYREVELQGGERVPREGPVLLAVNHPNALVDALAIGTVVPRRVRITAKAVLFDNPVLGAFLRLAGIIPLRRMSDELAKRQGAGGAGAVDPQRNAQSFAAILEAFDRGAAVLIFPEGKSHDEPTLAPLKTGPARIALAARAAGRAAGLQILPVGLVFEAKDAMRSRVLAVVGDPIDAHAWAPPHGAAPTAEILTAEIGRRLAAVVLTAPTPERLDEVQRLASLVAEILAPAAPAVGETRSLAGELTVARHVARTLDALEQLPPALRAESTAVRDRIVRFAGELRSAGIEPADVAISLGAIPGARFAVRESLLLAAAGPVAAFGRITHWVPFRLARRIALRDVTSRDQPAMRTIVAGVALVLATYALQGAVVWALLGGLAAAGYLVALPLAADVDLRYSERLRAAMRRMRAFFILRRNPALARLEAERRALAAAILALDAKLGVWEAERG